MLWVCLNVADVCFLSRGQKTFQECLQMGRQPELRAGLWILEQTPPPVGLIPDYRIKAASVQTTCFRNT